MKKKKVQSLYYISESSSDPYDVDLQDQTSIQLNSVDREKALTALDKELIHRNSADDGYFYGSITLYELKPIRTIRYDHNPSVIKEDHV